MAFIYYVTQIQFEYGAVQLLKQECERVGITRPLVVTDKGLAGLPMIASAMAQLQAAGLDVVRHLHVGHPADVVVKLADVLECDYVGLGRHGRGVVADLILGSVATRVLQRSTVPVLLVG